MVNIIQARRTVLIALATVAMAACENDVNKMQRLSSEQVSACLGAQVSQEDYAKVRDTIFAMHDRDRTAPLPERYRAMLEKTVKQDAECELATRKYQAFKRE